MPKVTLNKTVKVKGKGMILAGVEIDVTAKEKEELEKAGHIGESKRSASPTNEKEIQALVAEVSRLENENKDLKAKLETLKNQYESTTKDDLLGTEDKKGK